MILFKRLAVITLLFAFASTMELGQTKHRRTRRTVRRSTVTRRAPVASTTTAPRVPLHSSSFLLANSTPVAGVINQALSTQPPRTGDTFTMRVTSPSEYRGAVVNGHLSGVKRSGKLTGRSEMTLNFDRIRLPNGDSYRFAGTLESMRLANGETVNVDNEGTVQEKSQTSKTEKRAAIG